MMKYQEPKWKLRWAHSDQGICWNIAPLNFQRNDAKPTPFLSAPLNNVRQKKCPPQLLKAFLLPPLKLNGDLKPLLVPP